MTSAITRWRRRYANKARTSSRNHSGKIIIIIMIIIIIIQQK